MAMTRCGECVTRFVEVIVVVGDGQGSEMDDDSDERGVIWGNGILYWNDMVKS
jgi:hypothetical protein